MKTGRRMLRDFYSGDFIKSMYLLIGLALCLMTVTQASAQSAAQFLKYGDTFPNSNKITVSRDHVLDISLINDEIEIEHRYTEIDYFPNESAVQFSKESVSYSSFFELLKVEAATLAVENGNLVEHKVEAFKKKDDLDGSFHDDVKSLNFIYPKLGPGSATKLSVSQKIKNPRFINAFYFGDFYPVIHSSLSIHVDEAIVLDFKEFNTEHINIVKSSENSNGKIIYTLEADNVDKTEMDSNTPNYKNYFPHVVPVITSYKAASGETKTLLSGVKDLYSWYHSLIDNINKDAPDPALIQLVHELTAGKTSDLEKVKAIYYWAQDHIKYIDFEFALGGFIPRDANTVFNNKFGDCKDNSSIMDVMLDIAGLDGNLTWVGTRDIPYSYEELPTPANDNHMILTYKDGDHIYFLDATGRYIPLDLPTSFIQGKEVLIEQGRDAFEIVKVPVIPASRNKTSNSTNLNIDSGKLKGSGNKQFSGYAKINLFYRLENLGSQNKRDSYFKGLLTLGNNKFLHSNLQEQNAFDYDNDYSVAYDFVIEDYMLNAGDEYYIDLNLDKVLTRYKIEDSRKTSIEEDFKKTFSFVNTLNIPSGYTVDYLPENVSIESPYLNASISYENIEGTIVYRHDVTFDFLVLPVEAFPEYKTVYKKIAKAYKEMIVLKKTKE